MTKILVECYEYLPSFELNVQGYKKISKMTPIEVRACLTKDIKPEDIAWCDVLVDVRGGNPLSAYVVSQAKKAGRKVFLSLDDDLLQIFPDSYAGNVFRTSLLKVMRDADSMLTSSKYLGEKYKEKYGIEYTVTNTVIEPEQFKEIVKSEEKEKNDIKLVYAAGPQHIPFFDTFIKPILNRLYERYDERVSLTVIGPDIDTTGINLKIEKYSSMPFEEYRDFMNNNRFDIGLAPLFDSEFCRSKYFNKYLEYSINNICGIYSNVMPYTLVVEDGINGLLADNIPDSWFNAICQLVENPVLIVQYSKNAKEHILHNFNLESIVKTIEKDVPDLLLFKAKECSNKYCRFMRERYLYFAIKRRLLSHIIKY